MRVTSFMIFSQLTSSLQRNLGKIASLHTSLSSGKKIDKPSDDIPGLMRAMDYKLNINYNEQYKRNINEAVNHLEFTGQIMSSVSDALMRAKELAISGSSDTLNENDRMAIAKEIGQIRDHILNLSNTRFRGRYIFSGFKTDVQPFDSGTFAYNGDSGDIRVDIDRDTYIVINIHGDAAFSYGGISFAKTLDDLRIALENNDSSGIRASLDSIDNAINQTINVSADIGARLNRLDDQINRLDDSTLNLRSILSDTEDTDLAEVLSEISKTQTALEALRASSARALSQSLLDFLR